MESYLMDRSSRLDDSGIVGRDRTAPDRSLARRISAGTFAVIFFAIAPRGFASSHNGVTHWTKIFGPSPVDRGGDIPTYLNSVADANGSRALVVIEGTCISACTIKLAARNRCVRHDAILWFHAAVEGSVISTIGNSILIDAYPPRVREEVLRRHMLENPALDPENTLTGAELIELGERKCR